MPAGPLLPRFLPVLLVAFLVAALVAVFPRPSPGGPGDPPAPARPVVVLDTVRVSAPRPSDAERLLRSPGFSSAVRVDPGRASATGVAAVLREAPGVHVSSSGGPGAFATLSIRGSSAQQVGYYLDGVPLRWSEFGAVNLGDLPYESLARVEVYRGHVPYELGAGAPGGAVNLVSDTSRAVRMRLRFDGGSFGDRRQSFGASRTLVGWQTHAALTHESWRGDFTYRSDNGTPLNPLDDLERTRVNNDVDRWRGSLLALRGPVAVGIYGFTVAQGLPGQGYYQQAQRARYDASGLAAHAHWRVLAGAGPARLATEIFYTRGDQRFRDPGGEFRLGYLDSRSVDQALGARLRGTLALGPAAELGATLQQSVEHWRPEFVAPRLAARGANRSSGVLGARVAARRGRAEASAGARAEWWVDRGSTVDRLGRPTAALPGLLESRILPSAGVSVALRPGLWLKADAALYQRLPTMAERFGIEGSQVGNQALRPERGTSHDAGIAWRGTRGALRLELEGARFWGTATDVIVLEQNSQRTSIPKNSGQARVSGEEARVLAALGPLECSASATWLAAIDESDDPTHAGRQLPGRPEFETSVEASVRAGPVRPALRALHVGRDWLDRAHSPGSLVASRTLWAAEISVPLERAGLSLHAVFDNLSDSRVSDLDDYPLPGRSVRVGFTWVSSRGGNAPAKLRGTAAPTTSSDEMAAESRGTAAATVSGDVAKGLAP